MSSMDHCLSTVKTKPSSGWSWTHQRKSSHQIPRTDQAIYEVMDSEKWPQVDN